MKHNLLILLVFISSSAFGQENWNLCYKDDRKLVEHYEYFRIDGSCAPNQTCKCVKYSYNQGSLTSKTYHGFKNETSDITTPINDSDFLFRTFDEIYPNNLPSFHSLINETQRENIVKVLAETHEVPDADIKTKMDWLEASLREKGNPNVLHIRDDQKIELLTKLSEETTFQSCNPSLYQKLEDLITSDKIYFSGKVLDAPHHIFYYDRWGMFGDRLVLAWPDLKHKGAGLNLWGTLKDLKVSNFLISMINAYVMMTLNTDSKYQHIINQVYPMTIHQVIESKNKTLGKELKTVLEKGILKPYEKEVEDASTMFIVDNIPCVSN